MKSTIKNGFIDLHTHSTASDGTLSPAELVRTAAAEGLQALALTDHDTTSGNAEAEAEAKIRNITFIPGVEISCDLGEKVVHMLGYWIDYNDKHLSETLSIMVEYRTKRNHKIIRKLQDLGIDITYDMVEEIAGNEVVGRPHFAEILVRIGASASIQEAFNQYLGRGKAAYHSKKRLNAEDGIDLIKRAGGIACLAHPKQYNFNGRDETLSVLSDLKSWGLGGMEVYYPTHTPADVEFYLKMADELDLAVSGGSDFHGPPAKPDIKLGRGLNGNLKIGMEILDNLIQRHRKTAVK